MSESELLIGVIGLWLPVTFTLISIATKFGKMVNSVETMQAQLVGEKVVLDDIVIRITKLEVKIDGKI